MKHLLHYSFRHSFFSNKKLFLFLLILVVGNRDIFSQTLTGTIRGVITDHQTQSPLADVNIALQTSMGEQKVITNDLGEFIFEKIPVGRHDLLLNATGFTSYIKPAVLVGASQETVLDLTMEPVVFNLKEVSISPDKHKGQPKNRMAGVSALSFDMEETRKFAGGLDDPTRLVANFPGVAANPFISDNTISVRGNSPRGLKYRLEGIDIPNPNHFARIGSSAGSFTIFSNQLLTQSDFFLGAFPAEYGNATAGVFDIRFRNGNHRKKQFTFQAGVLGIDFSAEGPFKKDGKASYLVNYRYATLNFVNRVIDYLSIPTYQDLSFKLHLPTKNIGTFAIFGLAGISKRTRTAEQDSTLWTEDLDRFENVLGSDMVTVGLTHQLLIGQSTIWKSGLVGSLSFQQDNKSYIEDDLEFQIRDVNEYTQQPLTFTSTITHRFNPRHTHKSGIILTTSNHDYFSSTFDYVENRRNTLVDEKGRTNTVQAYSQSQFRISSKLTANAGVHFLYHDLNDKASVEPRLSFSYQFHPKHNLAIGYGLHSQIETYGTYMTRLEEMNGEFSLPNKQLDFLKAHHAVLSYTALLSPNLRFRSEVYHQYLTQVPVEKNGTYAVINLDQLDQLRILENLGTSRNIGLDLGLERFTQNGFYYMTNASIYDSRYTDAQGVQHSTAFNARYNVNLLAGKEFKAGKKNGYNSLFGINATVSALGGQRYTPIDLEQSRLARRTVYDERVPFSEQETPLFILDLTLTYHTNGKVFSDTWAIQIKNILQNSVPEYREYDTYLDEIVFLRGASLLPVFSYTMRF